MSFFDDLRKSIDALSKASENVVKKSGSAVELRKLKMEQESLKRELNNCYAQIGRLVVGKMDRTNVPEEMEMLVQQIEDCKEAIAENEQLIARMQGIRLCPVCGEKADKEAVFCQKCGTRLPDYSAEEEEAETDAPEEQEEEAAPEPETASDPDGGVEEAAAPEAEAAPEDKTEEPEEIPE